MESRQIRNLLGDNAFVNSIFTIAAGERPTDEAAAKQYDAAKEIVDAYEDLSGKGSFAKLRAGVRVGRMLEAYATAYGEPQPS